MGEGLCILSHCLLKLVFQKFIDCVISSKTVCDMPSWFIYLLGILRHFQHYTGHITAGSWEGRGNQYIQLVKFLYCKLPTNGKQIPAFPLEVGLGTKPRSQRWEVRV